MSIVGWKLIAFVVTWLIAGGLVAWVMGRAVALGGPEDSTPNQENEQ